MPLVEHTSKFVFGWAVGQQANSQLALEAWRQARATFQQLGVDYARLIVHHDQDPVYTGYAWTGQLLLQDQVRRSYALNGAKDNPEMEPFKGRFKTENQSLFLEAETLSQLRDIVANRIEDYNTDRRHSSLGYLAPFAFIKQRRSGC